MTRDDKIELLQLLDAKELTLQDKELLDSNYSLIQKAYLLCAAKIRILCGANRSGKSKAGADDINIRSTGIIPNSLKNEYPESLIRIGEYWCSSLDFPSSREISQRKIIKSLPKKLLHTFNKEFRVAYLENGSEVGFKSADSGREKYQGTSKVGQWDDEEHPKDVWDEQYMRSTDCKGWLSLTFTPVEGLTWAHKELYKLASFYYYTKNKHGISEEVGIVHTPEELKLLKDRELVILPNTSTEADPSIVSFQMAIYDNPFLPDSEIQNAERKYKDDPAQYNARVLGRFTKISGRNVFNTNKLIQIQQNLNPTFERGQILDGQFKKMPNGQLTVYKTKKEMNCGWYVIGADVAAGKEEGDYNCAQVLDRMTCEQVAVWHGHCSPDRFADILVDLAKYYNNAFLAPEINFHGFGVVNRIRDHYKYLRLYYDYDQSQTTLRQGLKLHKKYGWETTSRTKPIMIQTLASFINDEHIRLNDFHTVDELITFVYDKEGTTEAMGGCYDDRVIALAIALQLFKKTPIVTEQENITRYKPQVSEAMGY